MSCETMQENVVRRLAGDLAEPEARELDRHLSECADCRATAEDLTAVWNGLGELSEERPSSDLRRRFDAMLRSEIAAEERRSRPLSVSEHGSRPLAASEHGSRPLAFPSRERSAVSAPAIRRWLPLAAVLAIGFSLGWLFWGRGKSEVVALRQEVGELHQMVAQSLLEKSSVSDRLQGVAYSREYSAADPGVAAALVQALQNDTNVNVRLAALEALRPIAAGDAFRSQLVAVAARPDSPLVSLSIIDVLLEAGTPEARHDLEELMNDPNLEPVVRGYLRDRLGRRI